MFASIRRSAGASTSALGITARSRVGRALLASTFASVFAGAPAALAASQQVGPAVAVDDAGVGTVAWNLPFSPSPLDANVVLPNGVESHYLKLSGFDFSGLPSDARIVGIRLYVGHLPTGEVADGSVFLLKNDVPVGGDQAKPDPWVEPGELAVYEPVDPLWGTTWTVAELQADALGVLISAQNPGMAGDSTAVIDPPAVEVLYLGCSTAPADCNHTSFDIGSIAGEGQLSATEGVAGKEKLSFSLKFDDLGGQYQFLQPDFGDPTVANGAGFSLCVYNDADVLVSSLRIDNPGATCGDKPCWKNSGDPYPANTGSSYSDKSGAEDGVVKLKFTAKPGKFGSVKVKADNKAGQLPLGTTAGLAASTDAYVQFSSSTGQCYYSTLNAISKQTATQFKAKSE